MTTFSGRFDLAVVGAGIIGLATALAAVRRGLRVVVVDRDAQANGASVRNFGFIATPQCIASIFRQCARRSDPSRLRGWPFVRGMI